jgi:hypothetical protein
MVSPATASVAPADALAAAARPLPVFVGVRWTPLRLRALRHGLWFTAALFALYGVGIILDSGVGLDAHAYWSAWRHGHTLYSAAPEQRDAYLYSPAFAQAIWPLTLLPWAAFVSLWAIMAAGVYAWLLAPLGRAWAIPLLIVCLPEVAFGNVWSFFALALVLGFRFSAAWAFPILLKLTPGIGLLWFAVRREWRSLGVAVLATACIAGLSFAIAPHLWIDWFRLLVHPEQFKNPSREVLRVMLHVPLSLHLLIGIPLSVAVTIHAARTDRKRLLPLAMMLAAPVWGLNAFALLTAIPRLRQQEAAA